MAKKTFIIEAKERWLYRLQAETFEQAMQLAEEEAYQHKSEMRGFEFIRVEEDEDDVQNNNCPQR